MIRRVLTAAVLGVSLSVGTLFPAYAAGPAVTTTSARNLPDFADLVEKVGPAVVNIRTAQKIKAEPKPAPGAKPGPRMPEGMDENDPLYDFFRRFFPPGQNPQTPRGSPGEEVPRGVGSGFFISSDGFLLTNHHVVEGADEIYVTLTDKREFKGRLIGSDKRTDVALVKVEATGLPRLTVGDSIKLRVGEWVLAIGSPFGLENTVTAGIVSAKGRDTGEFLPFIQTDVAVNPGNSGGPLINMAGEVVGINSQIYSRSGGFMGISFAIPIDEAIRVSDQLRNGGRVVRGRIGVGIADVTKEVAEPLGLARAAGALVRNVESGGPADKAGVEAGDIITRFDGKTVEKSSELPRIVGGTKPGSRVNLTVWRKGASKDLTVTVAELEPEKVAAAPKTAPVAPASPAATAASSLGLTVTELSEERRTQLKVKSGVVVEGVDGPASRAGLRPGDVLLALNNVDITGAKQFADLASKLDKTRAAALLVRRGDGAQYVTIRPAVVK